MATVSSIFIFLSGNKQFTEFDFTTGNDLETSEVPLSVLFCIIEKNAFSICIDTSSLDIDKLYGINLMNTII